MDRQKAIDIALTWNQTPYLPGGRIKQGGCDCGTFLLEVFHEAELIPYVDVGYYAHDHHLHSAKQDYLGWVKKYAHQCDKGEYKKGDIILYTIGKCVSHGAIIMDYPVVIHSVLNVGVMMSDISQERWKSRESYVYSCFKEGD